MKIARAATNSQAEPDYGPFSSTGKKYRFIAKNGGYATPWRSIPKDGIVTAMHKLSVVERTKLGEQFGVQVATHII